MMAAVDATPPAYERIDLHTHSRHSDGSLSPAELVALAAQRQVQLLALTDHDTLGRLRGGGRGLRRAPY